MRAPAGDAGPKRLILYTLLGLMQVFWSANFLIGKAALREFPPVLLVGLRVVLAAALILPIYLWRGRRAPPARDLPAFLLLGLVGVGVNQFFFTLGLSQTSVSHSSLIIGMTPVAVLILAAARGLERVTMAKLGGIAAALAGVAVLNLESRTGPGPTLAGDLMTMIAATAFAVYAVGGAEMVRRHGSLAANALLYAAAAVFLLPVVIWQGWAFPFDGVSAAGWASLVYMAVFPSLVCYLIFYYALKYLAPSRLTTLGYLQPVLATAGGALLLGERVSAELLAGGAIIIAGVYLAERGGC